MKARTFSKIAWVVFTFTAIILGITLLLAFSFPFEQLKPVIDPLAKDNDLESFTVSVYDAIVPAMRLIGIALAFTGMGFLIGRSKTQGWVDTFLHWLYRGWVTFWRDLRSLLESLLRFEMNRLYLLALLGISLIATLIRLALISRPFSYDEAYTFVVFALRPLRYLIADYHLPNNHVFHTILVHFSHQIFGTQPWTVRLPVLLAGILCVPAAYLAAKSLYDRNIALLSAGFIASSWALVDYSTNARGYILISLFSLLIFALGEYLRRNKNLAAWFLVIIFSVLGLYTIPTMLYPFGILMGWLFLSYLFNDVDPAYGKSFLIYLIVAGLGAAFLTLLLYMPIFLTFGVDSVIGNRFVSSIGWSAFIESVPVRVRTTGSLWSQGLTPAGGLLLVVGLVLSVIFHKRIARHRVPTIIATMISLALMLAIQQVAPLAKVWLFLLPFTLIWTAAGIIGLSYFLSKGRHIQFRRRWEIAFLLLTICITILLSWSTLNIPSVQRARDTSSPGEMEEAAIFLKDYLQPGDAVLSVVPVNFPLRAYLLQYDISDDYLYKKRESVDFKRVFIVVNGASDQTLEGVAMRGKMTVDFDLPSANAIHQYRTTTIYEVTR
jgi:hypothetical protein